MPTRPPGWALAAAAAFLGISVLLLPFGVEWAQAVGWALAAFGAIGFLAAYTRKDVRLADSDPSYVDCTDLARLRTVLVVLAFFAAAGHAWMFATMVAS